MPANKVDITEWVCVHCSHANDRGHAAWCRHKGKRIARCDAWCDAAPQRRKKLKRVVADLLIAEPQKTWHLTTLAAKTGADIADLMAVIRALAEEGKLFNPHASRRGLSRVKKAGGLT